MLFLPIYIYHENQPNGICKKEPTATSRMYQAFDALLSPWVVGRRSSIFLLLPWPLALWIWIQRIFWQPIHCSSMGNIMKYLDIVAKKIYYIVIWCYMCTYIYIYTSKYHTMTHKKMNITDKDKFQKERPFPSFSIFRVACSCWKVKLNWSQHVSIIYIYYIIIEQWNCFFLQVFRKYMCVFFCVFNWNTAH